MFNYKVLWMSFILLVICIKPAFAQFTEAEKAVIAENHIDATAAWVFKSRLGDQFDFNYMISLAQAGLNLNNVGHFLGVWRFDFRPIQKFTPALYREVEGDDFLGVAAKRVWRSRFTFEDLRKLKAQGLPEEIRNGIKMMLNEAAFPYSTLPAILNAAEEGFPLGDASTFLHDYATSKHWSELMVTAGNYNKDFQALCPISFDQLLDLNRKGYSFKVLKSINEFFDLPLDVQRLTELYSENRTWDPPLFFNENWKIEDRLSVLRRGLQSYFTSKEQNLSDHHPASQLLPFLEEAKKKNILPDAIRLLILHNPDLSLEILSGQVSKIKAAGYDLNDPQDQQSLAYYLNYAAQFRSHFGEDLSKQELKILQKGDILPSELQSLKEVRPDLFSKKSILEMCQDGSFHFVLPLAKTWRNLSSSVLRSTAEKFSKSGIQRKIFEAMATQPPSEFSSSPDRLWILADELRRRGLNLSDLDNISRIQDGLVHWEENNKKRNIILAEAKPLGHTQTFYRYGSRKYEKRLEGKKPLFQLDQINFGDTVAHEGLYIAGDIKASDAHAKSVADMLLEVTVGGDTLYLDSANKDSIERLSKEEVTHDDITRLNPPILYKYGKYYVLKDPTHATAREFTGADWSTQQYLGLQSELGLGAQRILRRQMAATLAERVIEPFQRVDNLSPAALQSLSSHSDQKCVEPSANLIDCNTVDFIKNMRSKGPESLAGKENSISNLKKQTEYLWRYDGSCGEYRHESGRSVLVQGPVDPSFCGKTLKWWSGLTCYEGVRGPSGERIPLREALGESECHRNLLQCTLLPSGSAEIQFGKNLNRQWQVSREILSSTLEPDKYLSACDLWVSRQTQDYLCLPDTHPHRSRLYILEDKKNSTNLVDLKDKNLLPQEISLDGSVKECQDMIHESMDRKVCLPGLEESSSAHPRKYSLRLPGESAKSESTYSTFHECLQAMRSDPPHTAWKNLGNIQKAFQVFSSQRTGAEMIKILETFPDLNVLYKGNAQVGEGYTVGEHTERVLDIWHHQAKFYLGDPSLKVPGVRNLDQVMTATLAFHDIGKSLGRNWLQHEFTLPILEKRMKLLGFNSQEIALAKVLTDHDRVGEYIQRNGEESTISQLIDYLVLQSSALGMDPKVLFRLQMAFYTADAGSYPGLYERVFLERPNGELILRNEKLRQELAEAFDLAGM